METKAARDELENMKRVEYQKGRRLNYLKEPVLGPLLHDKSGKGVKGPGEVVDTCRPEEEHRPGLVQATQLYPDTQESDSGERKVDQGQLRNGGQRIGRCQVSGPWFVEPCTVEVEVAFRLGALRLPGAF